MKDSHLRERSPRLKASVWENAACVCWPQLRREILVVVAVSRVKGVE